MVMRTAPQRQPHDEIEHRAPQSGAPATGPSDPAGRRRRVDLLLKVGIGVVLAVQALEEVRYVRNRMARRAGTWWDDLEHRERRRLHESQLGYLVKRLPSGR